MSPNRLCKDCEKIERNAVKNADRPAALWNGRVERYARKAGVPPGFMWTNMNLRAGLPVLRAMMTPEAVCLDCGHAFKNERDITIEHREPPRHRQDWARLHMRNLAIACASCNQGKGPVPYAQYLDDSEDERLANQKDRAATDETQLAIDFG